MVKAGEHALVTIGRQARPFSCHVCDGKIFAGHKVKLSTAVANRLSDTFAESAVSLVCQSCGYVHTFVSGSVQLWQQEDGYPQRPAT